MICLTTPVTAMNIKYDNVDVLLTVHLSTILVINQPNVQILLL